MWEMKRERERQRARERERKLIIFRDNGSDVMIYDVEEFIRSFELEHFLGLRQFLIAE